MNFSRNSRTFFWKLSKIREIRFPPGMGQCENFAVVNSWNVLEISNSFICESFRFIILEDSFKIIRCFNLEETKKFSSSYNSWKIVILKNTSVCVMCNFPCMRLKEKIGTQYLEHFSSKLIDSNIRVQYFWNMYLTPKKHIIHWM